MSKRTVFHRHQGWEGEAVDCPICRAHDALRRAEKRELEASAECDELRAKLRSALGQTHHLPIRADFDMDAQHGPIIRVTADGRVIAVYLMTENGVVTEPGGSQYGIEVKGPWWKLRQMFELPMLGKSFPVSTLPDCMMPDGGDACVGYQNLRKEADMMSTALYLIGEETLVPGNWTVTDWPSLNGMVSAIRHMNVTESRHALTVASLARLSEEVTKIAESRKDDWDFRGYALALMGVLMEARGKRK